MAAGETQNESKATDAAKAKATPKAKAPAKPKPKAAAKPHTPHPNIHKSHALLQHDRALKKKSPLPSNYPYKTRMSRPQYEARKQELQIELLKVQNWV